MARRTVKEAEDEIQSDQLEGFPHPRETAELIGHHEALSTVAAAIAAGRMHHAWLISGPKGIGKATLAYRIARTLLKYGAGSPVPPDLAMPEGDTVFGWIRALSHPDFLLLRRQVDDTGRIQNVISVNVARKAADFFALSAGEGGWRVCIVDSVDDMNLAAANALLKILEEPPKRSVFLLISHSPGGLLPTIRSRCRKLMLSPLGDQDLVRCVRAHFSELDGDDLALAARLAGGSPGRALAILRDGGLDRFREMLTLLMGLPEIDIAALHALGDRLSRANAEQDFDLLMEMLTGWLARMIRAGASGIIPEELAAGETALIARLCKAVPLDQWTEVWENINTLLRRADSVNLSRKQIVLSIFSRLAQTAQRR
ncbi:MAG: DNA polymerase III subunit delta' [Pseudomonadota bacterium]